MEILFQDEALVVVSKPNNMLVHSSYYARNIKTPSLVELLEAELSVKLFPVHRLDYKTSGVIILAKNALVAKELQKQFEENSVQKKYNALVRGYTEANGIVDTPVKNAETGVYKNALTFYKTIRSYEINIPVEPFPKSRYSFVELTPKTGRMHQLRKHMNKIAHPIIGDHKYGNRHHNRMFENELRYPNLFLHARSITFTHPLKGRECFFEAGFPEFWDKALEQLQKLNQAT